MFENKTDLSWVCILPGYYLSKEIFIFNSNSVSPDTEENTLKVLVLGTPFTHVTLRMNSSEFLCCRYADIVRECLLLLGKNDYLC